MRYLKPTRIIAAENTVNAEVMLAGNAVQPDFDFEHCTTINRGGYILLDFGKEISGGIAIAAEKAEHHPKDTDIRITFGESVMEALSSLGEKNACNDHAVRDFHPTADRLNFYKSESRIGKTIDAERIDRCFKIPYRMIVTSIFLA